jgi:hypothetical protein
LLKAPVPSKKPAPRQGQPMAHIIPTCTCSQPHPHPTEGPKHPRDTEPARRSSRYAVGFFLLRSTASVSGGARLARGCCEYFGRVFAHLVCRQAEDHCREQPHNLWKSEWASLRDCGRRCCRVRSSVHGIWIGFGRYRGARTTPWMTDDTGANRQWRGYLLC